MQPLQVEITVDNEHIKRIVEETAKELTTQHLLYVDVNKILELTCMSKRFAEEYILAHPKVKAIERRRERKRLYPYREFVKVLDEIIDSW